MNTLFGWWLWFRLNDKKYLSILFYSSCLIQLFHPYPLVRNDSNVLIIPYHFVFWINHFSHWILIYVLSLGDKHDKMFDYFSKMHFCINGWIFFYKIWWSKFLEYVLMQMSRWRINERDVCLTVAWYCPTFWMWRNEMSLQS